MTAKPEVTAKIHAARQSIDDAEADLGRLLADVNAAPRAEKTTITPVLEAAFDKLRKARINLRDLEKMIDGTDA